MLRLAANLDWLFPELEFGDRFAAAASVGFQGIELQFPHHHELEAIAAACSTNGLEVALMNAPAGDWDAGDRGLALRDDETWEASLATASRVAVRLGCSRVHVMSGLGEPDRDRPTLVARFRQAGDVLGSLGITVCVEPLNPFDVPRYVLPSPTAAAHLVRDVDHDHVRLQFDAYHVTRVLGDWRAALVDHFDIVAHVQLAGAPDRDEPDHGAVDGAELLRSLDELGYDGWVGAEYRPRGETRRGLAWAGAHLRAGGSTRRR